jgi:hypothetical protein
MYLLSDFFPKRMFPVMPMLGLNLEVEICTSADVWHIIWVPVCTLAEESTKFTDLIELPFFLLSVLKRNQIIFLPYNSFTLALTQHTCSIQTFLSLCRIWGPYSDGYEEYYFWDITPCSPLKASWYFGVTYCLHLQGCRINWARNYLCLPPAFTLVSCPAYSSTLKMEAICSSEISVDFCSSFLSVIFSKFSFLISVLKLYWISSFHHYTILEPYLWKSG